MPLDIKELTLQYLLESPLGKDLEEGLAYLERIQDTLYHLINKEDSDSLTKMKVGTVLTFAVLKQIAAENSRRISQKKTGNRLQIR